MKTEEKIQFEWQLQKKKERKTLSIAMDLSVHCITMVMACKASWCDLNESSGKMANMHCISLKADHRRIKRSKNLSFQKFYAIWRMKLEIKFEIQFETTAAY